MKKIIPILLAVSLIIVGGVALSRRTQTSETNQTLMALPTPKSDAETATQDTNDTGLTIDEPVKEITLTVANPIHNSTVTTASITIKGNTTPNADVFINEYETKADATGLFRYTMTLDEGENIIIIVANDENGNLAEEELIVNYEP